MEEMTTLEYTIYKSSGHAEKFLPSNIILEDSSNNDARWISPSNDGHQYIMMKLKSPSILRRVHIGKHIKPCTGNLRRFRIYSGRHVDEMRMVLQSGLRNDTVDEEFVVHGSAAGLDDVVQFVRIDCLDSWGTNFSIWHIRLEGDDQSKVVKEALERKENYDKLTGLRSCLRFLRESSDPSLNQLGGEVTEKTGVRLEGDALSQLRNTLVDDGDLIETEKLILQHAEDGQFTHHLTILPYSYSWEELNPGPSCVHRPKGRGGHQVVIDVDGRALYLHGGSDGATDLADFWRYDILANEWTCMSENTAADGGPTARNCHRMVIHPRSFTIYVMGRYAPSGVGFRCTQRPNDMFAYNYRDDEWIQIAEDTHAIGGPPVIYDHQMCVDETTSSIYVFGGRMLTGSQPPFHVQDAVYSSMFRYDIMTGQWNSLVCDDGRVGHAMVLDESTNKLIIMGGMRNKQTLTYMVLFDPNTENIGHIRDAHNMPVQLPPPMCIVRACIANDHIVALGGLSSTTMYTPSDRAISNRATSRAFAARSTGIVDRLTTDSWESSGSTLLERINRRALLRAPTTDTMPLHVYSIGDKRWTPASTAADGDDMLTKVLIDADTVLADVLLGDKSADEVRAALRVNDEGAVRPTARNAHQFVHDPVDDVYYMFGGNPGIRDSPDRRMEDLWRLKLHPPSINTLLEKHIWQIRLTRLGLLLLKGEQSAMEYIQTHISPLVLQLSQRTGGKALLHHLANRVFEENVNYAEDTGKRLRQKLFDSLAKLYACDIVPTAAQDYEGQF